MKTKIGINGFGRIGRNVFRALTEKDGKYPENMKFSSTELEVAAINDLAGPATLAHLLKYDSVYGINPANISVKGELIIFNGMEVCVLNERNPGSIDWRSMGVDIVLESTGLFNSRDKAEAHISAGGAKKVLISAPAKDADITVVIGVNDSQYCSDKHNVISNASCTTNCLAPVAKLLNDAFGITKGFMTTVHSYTNDQRILDQPHSDLRRARAAGMSIIPTKTGAAKAIGLVIPELEGKLDGCSLRVPTPAVSLIELVAEVGRDVTRDEVNELFRAESESGDMKYILGYSEEPLVSADYIGNRASATIDALSTTVIGKNLVKVVAWYDNEWGYSCRYADLARLVAAQLVSIPLHRKHLR